MTWPVPCGRVLVKAGSSEVRNGDVEMKKIATVTFAIAAASAVAACGGVAEQPEDNFLRAHATEPTGTEFDRNLHANYLLVAGQERAAHNWPASHHFSDKALQAASGQRVAPDTPEGRNLSAEEEAELAKARQDLVAKLEAGADSRDPIGAARAQVAFDCWIEEKQARSRRGTGAVEKARRRDQAPADHGRRSRRQDRSHCPRR